MKLERLRPTDVKVGSVLPFNIYDRNSTLLLGRGHTIANQDILRRSLERGMFVDTDELESVRNSRDSQFKSPDSQFKPTPASTFDLVRGVRSDLANILYDSDIVDLAPVGRPNAIPVARTESSPQYKPTASSTFEQVRDTRSDLATLLLAPTTQQHFQQAILNIAREIQSICKSDGDAVVASIILDQTARYPVRHSVNTAVATELVLRHVEPDLACRLSAMGAALTMNIAMLRLQEILYHQAEPLNAEQKATIVVHPAAGAERLRAQGVTDQIWLRAVTQHHEQLDGAGYPKGLANGQLTREGQVIAIAERYCAMVSERSYRGALLPNAVLKKLFMESASLNQALVELLIKEFGIYPPGSYVRLANGELAIVVKRTDKAHKPLVRLLGDAHGEAIKEEDSTRDTNNPSFRVLTSVLPAEVNVPHDPISMLHKAR